MEVSLGTASKAMDRKILMGHPAPCTARILMAVRATMANNHHPAMVTVSPRVVMVSSMGAMLSSRQDTEVTLHREWQMEDMGNLLQTMAHQLAMDHPRVTVLHKEGMVGLHKDMVNSPNRATGSLLVQGFVKPGTRGLEQQMAKMEMENTGAGSIVASHIVGSLSEMGANSISILNV